MGFFSGLDTEPYDRQYSDRVLVIRILKYFQPHIKQLLWVGFYLLVIAAAGAAVPLLVSYSVEMLGEDVSSQEITWIGMSVVTAGVLVWLANWFRRRLTVQAIGDVVLAIRTDAFQAATAHDLSFYDEYSSGKIVSRITSDSREFGQMVTLITDLISQVAQALFVGIALAIIEVRLMLYLLGFLPVVFLIALSFRKMARKVTREGMRAMANVNAAIKETISGISVSKNFRQEEAIFNDFNDI